MKTPFFGRPLRRRLRARPGRYVAVSLLAVLLATSCAPSKSMEATVPTRTPSPVSTSPRATAPATTQTLAVQALATSRGPNLEATDPATVNLASGQLQLVEFFRFT